MQGNSRKRGRRLGSYQLGIFVRAAGRRGTLLCTLPRLSYVPHPLQSTHTPDIARVHSLCIQKNFLSAETRSRNSKKIFAPS